MPIATMEGQKGPQDSYLPDGGRDSPDHVSSHGGPNINILKG